MGDDKRHRIEIREVGSREAVSLLLRFLFWFGLSVFFVVGFIGLLVKYF